MLGATFVIIAAGSLSDTIENYFILRRFSLKNCAITKKSKKILNPEKIYLKNIQLDIMVSRLQDFINDIGLDFFYFLPCP